MPPPTRRRPPGGRIVERATGPEGEASATFDATRTYRYRLTRTWDPTGPSVAFVMLNPSTATPATRSTSAVRWCPPRGRGRDLGV